MQNERSGAPKHHRKKEPGAVLSPMELRGNELKRVVRSAAALRDLYDDADLSRATGRSRRTIQGWWLGSRPQPDALEDIARATGLPIEDLLAFVYFERGEAELASALERAVLEGIRRDRDVQRREAPQEPPPSQPRRPPERQ